MTPDGRTPVFVVSGFLGSGKTTLVNRLLAQEKESLVIVNEFGAVAVDHHLIENSRERTVALPNGCLCCHLRGDLEETLIGAAMRRRRGEIAGFDRVIVETSGIADPGPVAQTLFADQALARDFKLGPIVTVVDAADPGGRAASPAVARAQIAAADVIVLSKPDRTSDLAPVKAEVREINPHASCIAAEFGAVDPEILLAKSGAAPDFSAAASHSSSIRSFVLRFDRPVPRELLDQFLETLVRLRGADLLRVKGLLNLAGTRGPVVFQAVQHLIHPPVELAAWPDQDHASRVVFITRGVSERQVDDLFAACRALGYSQD